MASTKQFYLKFNVKDFQTDQKVRNCSASANGVYIHLMCLLFGAPERGKYLMRSEGLKEFAGILLQQNVQQNNQQISQQIKNICCCVAEHFGKHLPFTTKEIEYGLEELLENDVVYIDGYYLCQKRMLHDSKISISRSQSGKKGGEKTHKNKKEKEIFAKDLLQQNSQQKEQQKSNYNYNSNYNYTDKDNRGIGNTEGVQGYENLGEEGKDSEIDQKNSDQPIDSEITREDFSENIKKFIKHQESSADTAKIPQDQKIDQIFYEGHWTLPCPTGYCLEFLMSHKDFKNDRIRFQEKIWSYISELPEDELWERIRKWGVLFNTLNDGKSPERSMRGMDSWIQHFYNWFSKQNLSENPTQRSNNQSIKSKQSVGKLLPRDATIEQQQEHYRKKPRKI